MAPPKTGVVSRAPAELRHWAVFRDLGVATKTALPSPLPLPGQGYWAGLGRLRAQFPVLPSAILEFGQEACAIRPQYSHF